MPLGVPKKQCLPQRGTKMDGLLKAPSKATEIIYSINVHVLFKLLVKDSKLEVLRMSLYTGCMLLISVDFEIIEPWFSPFSVPNTSSHVF